MAQILPRFQAFDDDGDPLSGGLLHTLIAGGPTNKVTYSDPGLTTPNANPVVLDSRGEAAIFGSGTYKLILKTSGGVTLWTQDDVEVAGNPTIVESSLYDFMQRAIFTYNGGTTAYTVKAKTAKYFCKEKYCFWTSELTTNAIGTPAANTLYYLYLDYSAITSGTAITSSELIWSTTAPSWNTIYRTWMNGDDRCIFSALTNGTPNNILEFFHDGGNKVLWADQIAELGDTDIDTTWIDVDIKTSVPGFSTKAEMNFKIIYIDSTSAGYWRTNDQAGATGHVIGYASVNVTQAYNTMDVITDSAQIIEVKMSASNDNQMGVRTSGWYFPVGM